MKKWLFLLVFLPALSSAQLKHSASVYFTTDAEIYFFGPSFQWNTSYHFNEKYALAGYANYWGVNMYENRLFTWTFAAMLERRVGKKKRLYGAVGVAYQTSWADNEYRKRNLLLPTSRWGYMIPAGKWMICPELNLVGPYIEPHGYEIFTTPGIGVRIMRI